MKRKNILGWVLANLGMRYGDMGDQSLIPQAVILAYVFQMFGGDELYSFVTGNEYPVPTKKELFIKDWEEAGGTFLNDDQAGEKNRVAVEAAKTFIENLRLGPTEKENVMRFGWIANQLVEKSTRDKQIEYFSNLIRDIGSKTR